MPHNIIIPVLGYNDVEDAIHWLCNTFGFTVRWQAGGHRAQLSLHGGTIEVSEIQTAAVSMQVRQSSLMVRVPSVDSHYEHALQQRARILQPPADFPYGERQYSVEDPGGHIWTFSQSIADVLPEDWGGTSVNL